jgi:Protein of unknown function (DUF4058)
MPMHDWTLVEAGTFHAFHLLWIGELQGALNQGILPPDFYALAEQRADEVIPDILALHESDPEDDPAPNPTRGGVATLTKTKPKVQQRLSAAPLPKQKRRNLTIRHTSTDRIIAFIELVSPSNKDRLESVVSFCMKVRGALQAGIHVLLLDVFPPRSSDPLGMHGTVWQPYDSEEHTPPEDRPLTFAAYAAGTPLQAFANYLAVGDSLPEMPLFLTATKYVNVPLEETYALAYRKMPAKSRKVLEKKPA